MADYTMSQSSSRAQQNLRETGIGVFPVGVEPTYLATCNRCAQRIVTDTDLFIYDVIGKVIPTTGHRADKDGDRVRLREGRQVF